MSPAEAEALLSELADKQTWVDGGASQKGRAQAAKQNLQAHTDLPHVRQALVEVQKNSPKTIFS